MSTEVVQNERPLPLLESSSRISLRPSLRMVNVVDFFARNGWGQRPFILGDNFKELAFHRSGVLQGIMDEVLLNCSILTRGAADYEILYAVAGDTLGKPDECFINCELVHICYLITESNRGRGDWGGGLFYLLDGHDQLWGVTVSLSEGNWHIDAFLTDGGPEKNSRGDPRTRWFEAGLKVFHPQALPVL
ncbi:MAG: hypothetical protein AAB726_01665 [Patescibacteria group bacterium]